jgi:hypothetical protein
MVLSQQRKRVETSSFNEETYVEAEKRVKER